MPSIPLRVAVFPYALDFRPPSEARCVWAETPEERSQIWRQLGFDATNCVKAVAEGSSFEYSAGQETVNVSLRDDESLRGFWRSGNTDTAYLDITGMPYALWAPLLRIGLQCVRQFRIVYVEPRDYRRNPAPSSPGGMFDLSEHTAGIGPLPGFARIAVDDELPSVFVVLLGFEGTRTLHIADSVEVLKSMIVPIVPIPGFRLEYPSYTLLSNSEFVGSVEAWNALRYVAANDPFEVLSTLKEVKGDFPGRLIRIGLVGTKPNAVGAILFALENPALVELIYDHPVGHGDRATGVGQLLVYDLEGLL